MFLNRTCYSLFNINKKTTTDNYVDFLSRAGKFENMNQAK